MSCPCFKNNYGCNENCRCCGCQNKFVKQSLFEGNVNIVLRKIFRESLQHHQKDLTKDYLRRNWMQFSRKVV